MKNSLKNCLFVLLFGAVFSGHADAQDAEIEPAPEILELTRIEAGSWSYFEGSRDEIESRINDFLAGADNDVAALQAANAETGSSLLGAVRDNLTAYLALLTDDELELQALPQPQLSYSLDDMLRLAAVSRAARDGARQEQQEVEREQRVLGGASRRRDQAFKEYVDAAAGDAKIIAGLRLIQTRSLIHI